MKTIVSMLLCLMLLFGCTAPVREPVERVVVQTQYKPLKLDSWILQPVTKPVLNGNKWRDLSGLVLDYEHALQQCNMQLDAAREVQGAN